jgi:hypothetical protein
MWHKHGHLIRDCLVSNKITNESKLILKEFIEVKDKVKGTKKDGSENRTNKIGK